MSLLTRKFRMKHDSIRSWRQLPKTPGIHRLSAKLRRCVQGFIFVSATALLVLSASNHSIEFAAGSIRAKGSLQDNVLAPEDSRLLVAVSSRLSQLF